jgi:hypothetical protein
MLTTRERKILKIVGPVKEQDEWITGPTPISEQPGLVQEIRSEKAGMAWISSGNGRLA